MINVTKRMAEIFADLPYPHCEAPMRRQLSGIYVTWEVGKQSTIYASGKPCIDMATVNVGIWLPPTTPWADAATEVLKAFDQHSVPAKIDGSDWYPEVQRSAVVIVATLQEDRR